MALISFVSGEVISVQIGRPMGLWAHVRTRAPDMLGGTCVRLGRLVVDGTLGVVDCDHYILCVVVLVIPLAVVASLGLRIDP